MCIHFFVTETKLNFTISIYCLCMSLQHPWTPKKRQPTETFFINLLKHAGVHSCSEPDSNNFTVVTVTVGLTFVQLV